MSQPAQATSDRSKTQQKAPSDPPRQSEQNKRLQKSSKKDTIQPTKTPLPPKGPSSQTHRHPPLLWQPSLRPSNARLLTSTATLKPASSPVKPHQITLFAQMLHCKETVTLRANTHSTLWDLKRTIATSLKSQLQPGLFELVHQGNLISHDHLTLDQAQLNDQATLKIHFARGLAGGSDKVPD